MSLSFTLNHFINDIEWRRNVSSICFYDIAIDIHFINILPLHTQLVNFQTRTNLQVQLIKVLKAHIFKQHLIILQSRKKIFSIIHILLITTWLIFSHAWETFIEDDAYNAYSSRTNLLELSQKNLLFFAIFQCFSSFLNWVIWTKCLLTGLH